MGVETEKGDSMGTARFLIDTLYLPSIEEQINLTVGDMGHIINIKEVSVSCPRVIDCSKPKSHVATSWGMSSLQPNPVATMGEQHSKDGQDDSSATISKENEEPHKELDLCGLREAGYSTQEINEAIEKGGEPSDGEQWFSGDEEMGLDNDQETEKELLSNGICGVDEQLFIANEEGSSIKTPIAQESSSQRTKMGEIEYTLEEEMELVDTLSSKRKRVPQLHLFIENQVGEEFNEPNKEPEAQLEEISKVGKKKGNTKGNKRRKMVDPY